MKQKVFLDTDVILDVVFGRMPHFYHSQAVLTLIEKNCITGFTSSLILANCFYIISNNKNKETARQTVSKLRSLLIVLPFTDKEIGESLNSDIKDFEDGVQYFIAINSGLDIILTRNLSDFKNVDINVFTPKDFLDTAEIKKFIEADYHK
jgi:predicted nucleic acid-binding protein